VVTNFYQIKLKILRITKFSNKNLYAMIFHPTKLNIFLWETIPYFLILNQLKKAPYEL